MTLIEVMVAFVILLTATLPLAYLVDSVATQSANTRSRLEAIQLAERWVAVLSNSNPPLVTDPTTGASYVPLGQSEIPSDPAGFLAPDPVIGGTAFTSSVTYTQQAVSSGADSNQCASTTSLNEARPGVVSLQVKVQWGHGNSLTDSTNINYPKPGVQADGFLSIQVTGDTAANDASNNSWSTRVQTIPITLAPLTSTGVGASLPTIYPNADGCAFTQVPIPPTTGSYQVSVGQPVPGTPTGSTVGSSDTPFFADPAGQAFASGNTSHSLTDSNEVVNVTQQTNVAITFDEGANLAFLYPASTAAVDGVVCPGASSVSCITTGTGSSGASDSWLVGGSWVHHSAAGAARIGSVTCTSTGQICVGGGYTTAGGSPTGIIVSEATSSGVTTTAALPANVTDISSVVCPSAYGCYAIGTLSTGGSSAPILLAGSVNVGSAAWGIVNPPPTVTFSSLSSIACPQATVCELAGLGILSGATAATPGILRLDGDPATASSTPGWQPTITSEPLPTGQLTSIGQMACVSSTSCLALGVGDATTATDPSVLAGTISATAGTAGTWAFDNLNLPTGSANLLTGMACNGTSCVAIGSQGGSPLLLTAALSGGSTGDIWSAAAAGALPSGTVTITGVTCPNATDCLLSADIPTGTAPGSLVVGALSGGAWTWSQASIPPKDSVSFFSGISCASGGVVCAAVGASPIGAVMLTSTGGPSGPWSDTTPTGLSGAHPTFVPVAISTTLSGGWSTVVPYGSSDAAAPNPIYPRGGGYFVAAADCSAAASQAPAQGITTIPGGSSSTIVPLGTLPVLVDSGGTPVSGATVSLQASNGTGCNADSYTMPTTGPDGLSRTAVPFGTYTITITSGATTTTGTVTVAIDNTTFTSSAGITTISSLPTPVQVAL